MEYFLIGEEDLLKNIENKYNKELYLINVNFWNNSICIFKNIKKLEITLKDSFLIIYISKIIFKF